MGSQPLKIQGGNRRTILKNQKLTGMDGCPLFVVGQARCRNHGDPVAGGCESLEVYGHIFVDQVGGGEGGLAHDVAELGRTMGEKVFAIGE